MHWRLLPLRLEEAAISCGRRDQLTLCEGGIARLTLVGRDRIKTRIMRPWPDRVGERPAG